MWYDFQNHVNKTDFNFKLQHPDVDDSPDFDVGDSGGDNDHSSPEPQPEPLPLTQIKEEQNPVEKSTAAIFSLGESEKVK